MNSGDEPLSTVPGAVDYGSHLLILNGPCPTKFNKNEKKRFTEQSPFQWEEIAS